MKKIMVMIIILFSVIFIKNVVAEECDDAIVNTAICYYEYKNDSGKLMYKFSG